MKIILLIYLFLVVFVAELSAQVESALNLEDFKPYNNELSIGGGVHTTGWDVNVTYGFIKHNSRTLQFTASFSEIKHLKKRNKRMKRFPLLVEQLRRSSTGNETTFTWLNWDTVKKFICLGKDSGGMFSLAWVYGGNINFGLLKPYYLNLIYRNAGGQPTIRAEKFNDDNAQKF